MYIYMLQLYKTFYLLTKISTVYVAGIGLLIVIYMKAMKRIFTLKGKTHSSLTVNTPIQAFHHSTGHHFV